MKKFNTPDELVFTMMKDWNFKVSCGLETKGTEEDWYLEEAFYLTRDEPIPQEFICDVNKISSFDVAIDKHNQDIIVVPMYGSYFYNCFWAMNNAVPDYGFPDEEQFDDAIRGFLEKTGKELVVNPTSENIIFLFLIAMKIGSYSHTIANKEFNHYFACFPDTFLETHKSKHNITGNEFDYLKELDAECKSFQNYLREQTNRLTSI